MKHLSGQQLICYTTSGNMMLGCGGAALVSSR
ncbi:hypothetical protein NC652_033106 [Populus alba x Populus x berolinensis]|uniref:Uncharacterized protein n=1 Tax=Populus alba x Populus x berolinensis TaxID=444605 RepID=A0AAD6LT24_9ROSI|nr:hypothetical protein NC652_032082 [Populus alba x Populus x berolinensis]KAJ6879698.1 hypothetical protein NC652_033106 [Populus alba x Populus x berolinensis]KAJ6972631.1 hypothetical protein NC653_033056 [Populus alba x Populus x berolinensis]